MLPKVNAALPFRVIIIFLYAAYFIYKEGLNMGFKIIKSRIFPYTNPIIATRASNPRFGK